MFESDWARWGMELMIVVLLLWEVRSVGRA